MCRNCEDDWNDRQYWTKLIVKQMGKVDGDHWLWNETPFPADLPNWDQIAQALK